MAKSGQLTSKSSNTSMISKDTLGITIGSGSLSRSWKKRKPTIRAERF